MLTFLSLALVCLTSNSFPVEAQVIASWDFSQGIQDWSAVNATPLQIENDALVFEPTAADICLVSPPLEIIPSSDDIIEIDLRNTGEGLSELFWRSDLEGQYQGFSAAKVRRFKLVKSDDWQTVRIQPEWGSLPQIINFRWDPPEGVAGRYEVRSIRIVRYPAPETDATAFDFKQGAQGWNALDGLNVKSEGISTLLPSEDARFISPHLNIDATALPWLVLDATGPGGRYAGRSVPVIFDFMTEAEPVWHGITIQVLGAEAGRYNVKLSENPAWQGKITRVAFRLAEGAPGELSFEAIRFMAQAEPAELDAPATGLEFQTSPWRFEYRLPASPQRIDVSKQAPPETNPVNSDYTVAMWYFAAWEPEYTWDGWQQIAERSPWRVPLLYDSTDPEMEYSGIRYYRSSNPVAVDWHVHWMREHAVNLMVWDWYPGCNAEGEFDPMFFGNRALELGFLGKSELGGPAVTTNRFADTMPFAVMWTNHAPNNRIGKGLEEYIIDQFFMQPNYYRIDDKPLLVLWSVGDLIQGAGGEEQARQIIDAFRDKVTERGFSGLYIVTTDSSDIKRIRTLGLDGVTGYNYLLTGGNRRETHTAGERVINDLIEDYPAQSIPGHVKKWNSLADEFGDDYLLATTPMQNWEPTFRSDSFQMQRQTPDAYRELLRRAKATIEKYGLRKFVTIEAWNEWLEGSYVEPSTQWGMTYLDAIRDTFGSDTTTP